MHLNKTKIAFILIACVVFSIMFNMFTHTYDNKYYKHDANGIAGVASISLNQAKDTVCLISGWEFYQNKLYDSEYFKTEKPIPDANIKIGQYLGFELGDKTKSPHGYGTYRINLLVDGDEKAYSIDMPEIYSSYKLFVNGVILVQNGNPNPEEYECEIINTTVNFTAKNIVEIIIQVADYDHYYSGIIYPPVFGESVSVARIVNMREFVSNTYILTALISASLYMMLYFISGKDKKHIMFSIFCISYILYSSYPIIHSIFNTTSYAWYRAEDIGFVLLLGILALFVKPEKSKCYSIYLTAAVSVCVLIMPNIKGNLTIYKMYGFVMDAYKLVMFSYIIISSIIKLYKNKSENMIFVLGSIFFGICTGLDYPGLWYEPIVLGWGAVTGGFVMCILIGIMLFCDMLRAKKQNVELALINADTKKYIDDVLHDLKSPLFGITSLTEMSRAGIENDSVMQKIEERAFELASRINKLTEDRIKNNRYSLNLFSVDSLEFLKKISKKYQILADRKNIKIMVTGKNFEIKIDVEKIELALENLIVNSIRHTSEGGVITLESYKDKDCKGFAIHDTGSGMTEEQILELMNRGVSTQSNHMGLGLSIVMEAVKLHGGELIVKSEQNNGSTFLIKLS